MSNPTSARDDYPVMALVEDDQLAISPDAKRALDEIDRLRALVAERDTATPDPRPHHLPMWLGTNTGQIWCNRCSLEAEGAPSVAREVVPDEAEPRITCVACGFSHTYGAAVPVQEPVCVEVDISKALCRGLGGMPPCLTPNPRCPVCAVPNPESSPQ